MWQSVINVITTGIPGPEIGAAGNHLFREELYWRLLNEIPIQNVGNNYFSRTLKYYVESAKIYHNNLVSNSYMGKDETAPKNCR